MVAINATPGSTTSFCILPPILFGDQSQRKQAYERISEDASESYQSPGDCVEGVLDP